MEPHDPRSNKAAPSSERAQAIDIHDEKAVSEAIKNGDPRFVTILGPTVTAIGMPAHGPVEHRMRDHAFHLKMMDFIVPLPDELTDDTPGNPSVVEKYGAKLPMKLEVVPSSGPNNEWELWVDAIGRFYYFNPTTSEMRWEYAVDIPAHPVLERPSEKAESNSALPIRTKANQP